MLNALCVNLTFVETDIDHSFACVYPLMRYIYIRYRLNVTTWMNRSMHHCISIQRAAWLDLSSLLDCGDVRLRIWIRRRSAISRWQKIAVANLTANPKFPVCSSNLVIFETSHFIVKVKVNVNIMIYLALSSESPSSIFYLFYKPGCSLSFGSKTLVCVSHVSYM